MAHATVTEKTVTEKRIDRELGKFSDATLHAVCLDLRAGVCLSTAAARGGITHDDAQVILEGLLDFIRQPRRCPVCRSYYSRRICPVDLRRTRPLTKGEAKRRLRHFHHPESAIRVVSLRTSRKPVLEYEL